MIHIVIQALRRQAIAALHIKVLEDADRQHDTNGTDEE